jgi:hypothetical protein
LLIIEDGTAVLRREIQVARRRGRISDGLSDASSRRFLLEENFDGFRRPGQRQRPIPRQITSHNRIDRIGWRVGRSVIRSSVNDASFDPSRIREATFG